MNFKIITKKRNERKIVHKKVRAMGEKCGWTDDETEEEPWWKSFKSQPSTQTSSQDSSPKFEYFKLTSNNLEMESESEDKATNMGIGLLILTLDVILMI